MEDSVYNQDHVFIIKDTNTGHEMKSIGRIIGWSIDGSSNVLKSGTFAFKTKDNESGVKQIDYDNNRYKITAMMRNKPVPKSYEVISYKAVGRPKPGLQEIPTGTIDRKQYLSDIYTTAKRKCGGYSMFGGGCDYYHVTPHPMKMDDGRIINVEWLQASYFDNSVLINWKSDRLKSTELSDNELKQLINIV